MIKPKLPRLNKKIGRKDDFSIPIDYFDTIENKKCSPYEFFKYSYGSCIHIVILIQMAIAYNKICDNDNLIKIIDMNNFKNKNDPLLSQYKLYLLYSFTAIYGKEQQAWLTKPFIKELHPVFRTMLENTFRPKGPASSTKWLTQLDIDKVCNQYELQYKNYKYLGCLPADHVKLDEYLTIKYKDYHQFNEDLKNGIYKYSYITNTDSSGEPGQHWRSLLFNTKEFKIYFIDSVGNNPIKEDMSFINLVIEYMKSKNNDKMPDYRISKTRHQKSNTECGVYSLYFTIQFIKGESFDEFESKRIDDTKMIAFRNEIFSN